jgi:DNA-binding GntR family transcriptional regulator
MLAEVDERRTPRTRATVAQLMERYLDILQIEDTTRGAIRTGTLRPGDQLPTLKALCARYGVVPSTAQRAFALLSHDGLIDVRRDDEQW